jgi:hypothetical protein
VTWNRSEISSHLQDQKNLQLRTKPHLRLLLRLRQYLKSPENTLLLYGHTHVGKRVMISRYRRVKNLTLLAHDVNFEKRNWRCFPSKRVIWACNTRNSEIDRYFRISVTVKSTPLPSTIWFMRSSTSYIRMWFMPPLIHVIVLMSHHSLYKCSCRVSIPEFLMFISFSLPETKNLRRQISFASIDRNRDNNVRI